MPSIWHDSSFYETLLPDLEQGNFENIRDHVENTVGLVWRGVLPLGGGYNNGDYIPVRSARAPIKSLKHRLPPGCYALYGKHPSNESSIPAEHEFAVGDLEACKWKTASGNQNTQQDKIKMAKIYYDADDDHTLTDGYHVRGVIFSRTEDETVKVWTSGGAIAAILVVSPRGGRLSSSSPKAADESIAPPLPPSATQVEN